MKSTMIRLTAKTFLSQQFQYRFWCCLHFRDGTQADTHILHTRTKQIDIIVDNQEAVSVHY